MVNDMTVRSALVGPTSESDSLTFHLIPCSVATHTVTRISHNEETIIEITICFCEKNSLSMEFEIVKQNRRFLCGDFVVSVSAQAPL